MIPGRFAPPHNHADGSCQWGWQGLSARFWEAARGHEERRSCIRSSKRKWGGYADAFSFDPKREAMRGAAKAYVPCAQAPVADAGGGGARRGGRVRRRQRSRRRQRVGGDAAAAHLLRAAHAKNVRHLLRCGVGGGQNAAEKNSAAAESSAAALFCAAHQGESSSAPRSASEKR